jgi:DNA-binding response OmpR family regulator
MKILIADDDKLARCLLDRQLRAWSYEVVLARDGLEAWELLRAPDSPRLAILDWVMPGLDGPELCQRIRAQGQEPYLYTMLLTSKQRREDIVAGLHAGADDYIVKPFDIPELKMRLRAAARIVSLQTELVVAREPLRFQRQPRSS